MPKLSQLPEASSVNANDLLLISDINAGVSKGIRTDKFNEVVLDFKSLAGAANQGLALPADGAITYLTNFAFGSTNSDPITGEIVSDKDNFKVLATIIADQSAAPQKDAGVALWMKLVDASNTIELKIDEQWFIHVNQTEGYIKFSGNIYSSILSPALVAPITISFGVQALAKALTVDIASSSISVEDI